MLDGSTFNYRVVACLPLPGGTELNTGVSKGQRAHLLAMEAKGSQEPTSQYKEKKEQEEQKEVMMP